MGGLFRPISRAGHTAVALADSLLLCASVLAAIGLRIGMGPKGLGSDLTLLIPKAFLTAITFQLCLYYNELYEDHALRWLRDYLQRLVQAVLAAVFLISLLYYALPGVRFGRGTVLIFLLEAALVVSATRWMYHWVAEREAVSINMVILGTGFSAQRIASELQTHPPLGYRLIGFLGDEEEVDHVLLGLPILGPVASVLDTARALRIRHVVVALDQRRGRVPMDDLLVCRQSGIAVEEGGHLYERLTAKILVDDLRPSEFVLSHGFDTPALLGATKRAVEATAAAVLLALLSPFMLLITLAIRLDSRGAAVYPQERIGERGRPFELLKFRTMQAGAEDETGPVWSSGTDDPRVTRVGRWLRKGRLDELPQLVNVVRGDMSFVGPRPERAHFVEQFRKVIPYYEQRHNVKPGITGWAQVKFRYGSTLEDAEEKLQYELYYIKHMSLPFDFAILLDTLKVVMLGRGAK